MAKTKKKPVKATPKTKLPKEVKYNASSLRAAVTDIQNGSTIYKAAKKYAIPWSTLKTYSCRHRHDPTATTQSKRGKPFVLPAAIEVDLLSYINRMQEIGFGLTVDQICQVAYRLAEKGNIKHPFSKTKQKAGWYWWNAFKKRYNLTLRVPESLSIHRAQSATREAVNDFYKTLEALYKKLDIADKPNRIWNLDETGFQFVVKSGKIVARTGKTHVYKQTFGERGTTTTVLPCVNVLGDTIPPMIIFKGKRWDDKLKSSDYPCLIKLSEKGWINNDLFLEFFQHFVENMPVSRPAVLFMDSHKSHLTPEVLDLASKEKIYIVTYPPHLTHLLQPLDVGVFGPLKANWKKQLNKFQTEKPGEKPTRYDFLGMFVKAYKETIDKRSLMVKAFEKAGIFPINYNAIPDHALAPSLTTCDPKDNSGAMQNNSATQVQTHKESSQPILASENPQDPEEPQEGGSATQEILKIPTVKKTLPKRKQTKQKVTKGKVYEPSTNQASAAKPNNNVTKKNTSAPQSSTEKENNQPMLTSGTPQDSREPQPGCSGVQQKRKTKTLKTRLPNQNVPKSTPALSLKNVNTNICGTCKGDYAQDVKKKNGAEWIECQFCKTWYHMQCQTILDPAFFLCSECQLSD